MSGWIKLHRKILSNPVVCKDADHLAIWVYLLLNATHKEMDVLFGGKRTTIKPGQLLTGRNKMVEELCIDRNKIERVLKLFENEQQIEQQTSTKNRIISILSWHEYQESEQQNEQQVSNNRATSEQQVSTNKKERIKELKNERNKDLKDNTFSAYTSNVGLIESLESFLEFRKKIKKPMTDKAIALLLGNLDKLATRDEDKIAILEQSILNGWQSIYELKDKGGGRNAIARGSAEDPYAGINFGF